MYEERRKLQREYQRSIGEQFTRASLSIVNNIAEGSGKESKKGKAQFYCFALNSARECVPMITLLSSDKQITKEDFSDL